MLVLVFLFCVGIFHLLSSLCCVSAAIVCVCTVERTSPACGGNSVPRHLADSTCSDQTVVYSVLVAAVCRLHFLVSRNF